MAKQLRKRKEVNYKETESKHRVKNGKSSTSPTVSVKSELDSPSRIIPDVLYAEDGSVFYPCKNCCRAFSNKDDLEKHDEVCASGGRSTPSPFSKSPASNKENDDEGNNNEPQKTPKRKKRELNNNKAKVPKKGSKSAEETTSVITTGSASENINTLNESMKSSVLKIIKEVLKNTPITLESDDTNAIILQTKPTDKLPPIQITSQNLNANCVEVKTVRMGGAKDGEKIPDVTEIVNSIFGSSKAEVETDEPLEPEAKKTKPQENPDEGEIAEIVLDEDEVEGTIVLEDLDIHICKQCGTVFHSLDDLVNHDKYDHRNVKKKYPPNELDKYDAMYKESNDNKCPICAKVISTKPAWPRHLQTHSDVLKFECRICKKKFTRNDHRKLHEKRHIVNTEYL